MHIANRLSFLGLLVLGLLFVAPRAHSAPDIKENLDNTVSTLKQTQTQEAELNQQLSQLRQEVDNIRQETVTLAAKIRKNEASIDEKTKSLVILEEQLAMREVEQDNMRVQLAQLLHAMVHMQRVPRQFVVAQPAHMSKLLRTAGILNATYQGVDTQINDLRNQIAQIDQLKQKVVDSRSELKKEQQILNTQYASLESRIDEKRTLQRQLASNHKALIARVSALSKEAKSLQALLKGIEKEMAAFRQIGVPQFKPQAPKAALSNTKKPSTPSKSFARSKGVIPLPVQGTLIHRYGQKKGKNDTYKGQVIKTVNNATVTVPFNGEVVFTGPFMEYGNMIIIQHDKQYHTLLAGLSNIQVDPGQRVVQGEPVGRMGSTATSRKLYLELRKNSKAIDPAAWMGNVGGRNVAQR